MAQDGSTKREELEAWWALLSRVLSFALGAGILLWATVVDDGERKFLIVAGLALIGPVAAQSAAAMLSAIRSGSSEP